MSALPPKADIRACDRDVRFVPKSDILRCGKNDVIQSPRRRRQAEVAVSCRVKVCAADEIVRPNAPCSRTLSTVTLDLPSEERWG
jgi:hypothetical protein